MLSLKDKLILLALALTIIAGLGLALYLKGRRAGAIAVKQVDLKQELDNLDKEKHEIRQNVHALDTDALRTRILELSDRLTKESQTSHSK